MEFRRTLIDTCADATGLVVAIDVLRAFTTAAYAFAAGATQITLVGTLEEAFALRRQMPDVLLAGTEGALLVGEVGGRPIEGFDLPNSPSAIARMDLTGRELVQRTTAGTQGIVRSERAEVLLGASLCCARATVEYIRALSPAVVTFVITGVFEDDDADEDRACADYIEALLRGNGAGVDPAPYVKRVWDSRAAEKFRDPAQTYVPKADLELATRVDVFDFAMVVAREEGRFVMRAQGNGHGIIPRNRQQVLRMRRQV